MTHLRDVIYVASISVDGFIGSADSDDAWVIPDPELHRHFNELEGSFDLHLYGRRMYELMTAYWPTADETTDTPGYIAEYAQIWKAMPKVVFSKSLSQVGWNSRLFGGDALEEVARLKMEPGRPMGIGGAVLATSLAQSGLIDEFRFYVMPTIVGAGTPIFQALSGHIDLTTLEVRRFSAGAVLLRYRAKPPAAAR